MNKLYIIFIVAGALAAMISATDAYFADREISQNNTISAGTLDLALDETVKSPDALLNKNWQPGDELEEAIGLRNNGTLPINDIFTQAQTEVSD